MVHYKYIRKKGKLYGPYLYENKRVNGKVVTSYLGAVSHDKFLNKRSLAFFIIAFAVILLLFMVFWQLSFTGRASLDIKSDYEIGEELAGRLKLNIKEGELVPKSSKVIVSLGEEIKEFALEDLVDSEVISGIFFVDNFAIEGSGEGYGLAGKKIIYPEINFDLRIFSEKENEEEKKEDTKENRTYEENISKDIGKNDNELNEGGSEDEKGEIKDEGAKGEIKQDENKEGANNEENKKVTNEEADKGTGQETDIVGEDKSKVDSVVTDSSSSTDSNDVEISKDESSDNAVSAESSNTESVSGSLTDSGGESAGESSITGAVVSEEGFIVNGVAKKDNDFIYNLEEGQNAEIVGESARFNGSVIDDNNVKLNVENGKAIISTDYSIIEKGFGSNYLGDKKIKLEIDISKFGLKAGNDTELNMKLVYNNETFVEVKKDISIKDKDGKDLNESLVNETVIINETEAELNLTFSNLSLIKNIPDMRIARNSSAVLNLSEYFSGAERYELEISDLTASFEGEILTIRSDRTFSGMRKAEIIAYSGIERVESNDFRILVSSGAISISTSRKKVVVGEPVAWKINVSLESPENITIDIPADAENIIVKKIVSGSEEKANAAITGMISADLDINKESGLIRWIKGLFGRGRLTGRAVDSIDLTNSSIQVELKDDSREYIIEYNTKGPESSEEETKNGKRVIVSGDDKYNYTDVIASSKLNNKISIQQASKIKVYWLSYENAGEGIDIKGVDEVEDESIFERLDSSEFEEIKEVGDNFEKNEDISINNNERDSNESFINNTEIEINESSIEINETNIEVNESVLEENSNIIEDINVSEGSVITGNAIGDINIEQNNSEIISNETNSSVSNARTLVKHEIPFDAYDTDEDGFVDYIEWVVPHLSNQTFDIIYITRAEHLDENRTFIEDVYDLVKARDDVWTEPIPNEHYARVAFETNLSKDRDITIYARAGCIENSSVLIDEIEVPCEIYLKKLRVDELRREAY